MPRDEIARRASDIILRCLQKRPQLASIAWPRVLHELDQRLPADARTPALGPMPTSFCRAARVAALGRRASDASLPTGPRRCSSLGLSPRRWRRARAAPGSGNRPRAGARVVSGAGRAMPRQLDGATEAPRAQRLRQHLARQPRSPRTHPPGSDSSCRRWLAGGAPHGEPCFEKPVSGVGKVRPGGRP